MISSRIKKAGGDDSRSPRLWRVKRTGRGLFSCFITHLEYLWGSLMGRHAFQLPRARPMPDDRTNQRNPTNHENSASDMSLSASACRTASAADERSFRPVARKSSTACWESYPRLSRGGWLTIPLVGWSWPTRTRISIVLPEPSSP